MVEYVRMGYRRAAVCGHMTVLRSGELAMDSCWNRVAQGAACTAAPLDLQPGSHEWWRTHAMQMHSCNADACNAKAADTERQC